MIKRLVMLLFGIRGLIEIEEKPLTKLVIVHWRSYWKNDYPQDNTEFFKKLREHYDGWTYVMALEKW